MRKMFYEAALKAAQENFADKIFSICENQNTFHSYTGLSVCKRGYNFGPVINLDRIFDENLSVEENVAMVLEEIEKLPVFKDNGFDGMGGILNDYALVKPRLRVRLLGHPVPSILQEEVFGGWIVMTVHLDLDDLMPGASTPVKAEMLENCGWGVSQEKLFADAIKATEEADPLVVTSMFDVLSNHASFNAGDCDWDNGMYVATNPSKHYGAAVVLYKNTMYELYEKFGPIWVIPSSVHEVIILKKKAVDDVGFLRQMILDVNRTQVSFEDFLSDELFCYDGPDKGLVAV